MQSGRGADTERNRENRLMFSNGFCVRLPRSGRAPAKRDTFDRPLAFRHSPFVKHLLTQSVGELWMASSKGPRAIRSDRKPRLGMPGFLWVNSNGSSEG